MIWKVRVSEPALDDFDEIINWTAERFGERQARIYAEILVAAVSDLDQGPEQSGIMARDEVGRGIYTMHIARRGRKGRHFVMFRIAAEDKQTIEIMRFLHDAMDLARHVPNA